MAATLTSVFVMAVCVGIMTLDYHYQRGEVYEQIYGIVTSVLFSILSCCLLGSIIVFLKIAKQSNDDLGL